ncbi:hypothetical protein DCC85_16730 [Paenibacillus sp. CAA11]|uniref:YdeI/OmpD-associated family protein n=1 Tax=Paenibacillus sp. CAA11 TaxID=1532905 RepID=UPI000D3BDD77|nr:YdeI/OmpD-associated family protein [Paenibacillus sp. CAA11]AWB45682.1 hypothetical protein DCC85_16730 [Paenibacillus sp. CAA11]
MDKDLIRKLRLPLYTGRKVLVLNAPEGYLELLGVTEDEVGQFQSDCEFVLFFAANAQDVSRLAPMAAKAVKPDGLLWAAYPKGGAKAGTDLNRDKGWEPMNAAGREGIALIAVDAVWSAMRFRPIGEGGPMRRASVNPETRKPAIPLEVPDDLSAALKSSPEAAAWFAQLAPSHKRAYLEWIEQAKRAETRQKRIVGTVEKLSLGLKRPTDKI